MDETPLNGPLPKGTNPCPSCSGLKKTSHYLCTACWGQLPAPSRRLLNQRCPEAMERLRQLHYAIRQEVPLSEIEIKP